MPEKIWDMAVLPGIVLSGDEIARTRTGLRLVRRDAATGRYAPDAPYAAGEATLPEYRASGLTELYGLRADLDEAGGRVLLRLSADGGSSWLFHDGSSWRPALGGAWNGVEEVDRAIPDFPLAERRVRARVRLEPSPDGRETPVLRALALYFEFEADFQEDLARSLKHRIEARLDVRGAARRPPVHIATSPDFQVSEIPSIVLQFPSVTEARRLRTGDRKLDWALARRRVRERRQPVWLSVDVVCSCQSARKRETLAMADALARLFQEDATVVSEATGEEFTVLAVGPSNVQDAIGRGLFAVQVALTLTGTAWVGKAEEKRLAEHVGFALNGMDDGFREER